MREELITIRLAGKICVGLRLRKQTKPYCCPEFFTRILSGTVFNLILKLPCKGWEPSIVEPTGSENNLVRITQAVCC